MRLHLQHEKLRNKYLIQCCNRLICIDVPYLHPPFYLLSGNVKNAAVSGSILLIHEINYSSVFSHAWLATPQLVLHADWQEVWHSPQPPFCALSHKLRVSSVLILSMLNISIFNNIVIVSLSQYVSVQNSLNMITCSYH